MYCNLPIILVSSQLTKVVKILHGVPESLYNDKGIVHHRRNVANISLWLYLTFGCQASAAHEHKLDPALSLSVIVRKR